MSRQLATVRRIEKITPIPGADAIECAHVGGWKVVIKKDEYQEGDLAIYFEIDSWVPHEIAPFLSKGKEPKVYEGVLGQKLRTVRLRGQLSQGLLLPLSAPGIPAEPLEGLDVTERLGIVLWEKAIPAKLAGMCKGGFPSLIPKTDQERAQNLVEKIKTASAEGVRFEITEKLEGSSMTAYQLNGEFGVCSRTIELKDTPGSTHWQIAHKLGLEQGMAETPEWDFAIQGELVGPGIQGNIYKLKEVRFFVFDIYDIRRGEYLAPDHRQAVIKRLGLQTVPVVSDASCIVSNLDVLLQLAEGPSALNELQEREGLVFKQVKGSFTFKAVSNKYLLGG
jgi:RNA ligase (TIGR02306 family)